MTASAAAPRPARLLMIATYVVGGIGLAFAFSSVFDAQPSLGAATLLAVGAAGLLSFVRHALLHRSDAARMGWDLGRTNPFQIEVGIANLAWGILGVAAVALDWGLAVEAAAFLVFGIYMAGVAIFVLISARGENARPVPQLLASLLFAAMLLVVGIAGITAAT